MHKIPRRHQVVIARMRIGHSRLTHKYLFEHMDPPICICSEIYTTQHVFECTNFARARLNNDIAGIEVLKKDDTVTYNNIIEYLHEINILYEI